MKSNKRMRIRMFHVTLEHSVFFHVYIVLSYGYSRPLNHCEGSSTRSY